MLCARNVEPRERRAKRVFAAIRSERDTLGELLNGRGSWRILENITNALVSDVENTISLCAFLEHPSSRFSAYRSIHSPTTVFVVGISFGLVQYLNTFQFRPNTFSTRKNERFSFSLLYAFFAFIPSVMRAGAYKTVTFDFEWCRIERNVDSQTIKMHNIIYVFKNISYNTEFSLLSIYRLNVQKISRNAY